MQAHTLHTLLLLSEDYALRESVTAALGTESHYRLIRCASQREAAACLDSVQIHLLIADADMIEDVEKNVFVDTRISHPQVARLLVGSAADLCVDLCRRAAAYLYLLKPTSDHQLRLVASRALELNELSRRHRLLSREFKISMDDGIFAGGTDPLSVKGGLSQFEKMVFVSAKMADLCAEARQAAKTELPVLILGETGTGKELLARAIHFNSPRVNSPLHVQNCGGICDDTLHSELFGHVRGAFTGAISDRLGLFRAADGGTVFLDEISEISPRFQVSLLRFLQEREIKPLGSDKIQYADVRIIAASNRPLHKLVELGAFRRDLYYRLKGFELFIPSLRERPEDIPVLAQFFIEKYAGVVGRHVIGITMDALAKLQAHDFPGNVRELETEIRRMVAIAEHGGYIAARHLSSVFDKVKPALNRAVPIASDGETLKDMVETFEKQIVAASLRRHRWNQSRSAHELGLSRVGLANKIKRYGLHDA